MAKDKISPHRVEMTEGKREIIKSLLSEYDIQSAEDIEEALKDLLGGTIKEMFEGSYNLVVNFERPFFSRKEFLLGDSVIAFSFVVKKMLDFFFAMSERYARRKNQSKNQNHFFHN